MSVRIESELALREALDGLALVQDKKILFNGEYSQESDGPLYHGLLSACAALLPPREALTTDVRFRYQESLKRLESIEAGCKKRLKPEYYKTFSACVAFLQAQIGKMYVKLILILQAAHNVRQWLEELKALYTLG